MFEPANGPDGVAEEVEVELDGNAVTFVQVDSLAALSTTTATTSWTSSTSTSTTITSTTTRALQESSPATSSVGTTVDPGCAETCYTFNCDSFIEAFGSRSYSCAVLETDAFACDCSGCDCVQPNTTTPGSTTFTTTSTTSTLLASTALPVKSTAQFLRTTQRPDVAVPCDAWSPLEVPYESDASVNTYVEFGDQVYRCTCVSWRVCVRGIGRACVSGSCVR